MSNLYLHLYYRTLCMQLKVSWLRYNIKKLIRRCATVFADMLLLVSGSSLRLTK